MIKAIIFDFSRTLLFPKNKDYSGGLNSLYRDLMQNPDFNFFDHFELNSELLNYLKGVKDKVDLYIFTSEGIQDDPAVKNKIDGIFKKVFSAMQLGMSKKDPSTYKFIAESIAHNPEQILFIDDSVENISAAKASGLKVIEYKDNSVIGEITSLGL